MPTDFWQLVAQVLVLLTAALVLGALFERIRQSAILGYMLAGTVLGPGGLGVLGDVDAVQTIAELGVAMLLFTIGLDFSLRRLLSLGKIGLIGGSVQVVLTTVIGAGVALLAGLRAPTAVAIGAMGALSSTACVLRVLIDRAAIDSVHGRGALGILLLQDLAVVPLVLLVAMMGGEGGAATTAIEFGRTIFLIAAMIGVFYVISQYVMPRMLHSSVLRRNRELLILLASLVAVGSSWVSHTLGLSPALGAFIAGVMLAESPFALQLRSDVGTLRALFVAMFFLSIGTLGDPGWIASHLPQVSVAVAVVVIGKAALIAVVARSCGLTWRPAVAVGVCLAQVGEFSFVVARVARQTTLGDGTPLIDADTFQLLVSATLVTLFISPFLVSVAPNVGRWFDATVLRTGRRSLDEHRIPRPKLSAHVVVVGFGPAGRAVCGMLQRRGNTVVVIDANPANTRSAHQHSYAAHVADARAAEVWRHVSIDKALAVVVTLPDYSACAQVVQQVRASRADIPVVARSRYHVFVEGIRQAGADRVVDEEELMGYRLGVEARRAVRSGSKPAPEEAEKGE